MRRKRKHVGRVDWQKAPDISIRIAHLVSVLEMDWIKNDRIYCFRSVNSRARAYARIWGFNKVWQLALDQNPAYSIEVLSENFDRLSDIKKMRCCFMSLHIFPKTSPEAYFPTSEKGVKRNFHDRVDQLVAMHRRLKAN
jgi:predicted metallopeptidase